MGGKKVSTKSCIFRFNQINSYDLEKSNLTVSFKRSKDNFNRIYLFLYLVTLFQLLIINKLTLAQHTDYGDVSGTGKGLAEQATDNKYLHYNTGNSMNQKLALDEKQSLRDSSTQDLAHETNLENKNNLNTNQAPSSGRAMDIVKKAVKKAKKTKKKLKQKLKKKIKKLAHKAKTKFHHAVHQASTG